MSAICRDNRGMRSLRAWRAVVAWLRRSWPSRRFAQATNSIDQVTVSKGASGRTIVRFPLKNPPANPPAGFAIASPPRIALDFLDTANGLGATQRAIDDVALRSLNVIQAGNRTRVVFNLNRPQTFETQVEGNAVLVTLIDQGDQLDARAQTFSASPRRSRAIAARAARRRLPPRPQRRGPHRRRPVRQRHRHRHPPAGPAADRRLHQDLGAAQSRAAARRAGLRHAGRHRRHVRAGRERADDHRAEGPVGALGLPDRTTASSSRSSRSSRTRTSSRRDPRRATRARSCRSTSRTSKCARCCR